MNHLKQIVSRLGDWGLDAMLLTSPPGEFYAVGFHGEGIVLAAPNACRYYTDARYLEAAQASVTGACIIQIGRGRSYKALLRQAVEELGIRRLGFEEERMTVAGHQRFAQALPCELVPAQPLLDGLRGAKDPEELALMRQAQAITDQAFSASVSFIRPGMTECEIAARLQYEMLCRGAQRMSFDPIVVTGANGSLPHGVPGAARVEPGSFITMDFGCVYGGYCSDMTRTVAVGQPSEEMRQVYEVVLQAQQAGIAATRAGVPGQDVDAAARAVIRAAGYGDYFGHSYGHSLGLEIHEAPNASPGAEAPLPAGAVVSAEPGIYLPGRFGVRIEDVVVVTPEGCEDITASPKELLVL